MANVAFLPGIQMASLAMPDIHWGYGFCIGGVCATDPVEGGVISPGGVGYDINCGVRLMTTNLSRTDVQAADHRADGRPLPRHSRRRRPRRAVSLLAKELRRLMGEGVSFLEGRGLATDGDVQHTEANGCLRRRRAGGRQPACLGTRPRSVRHAWVGQPFSRSAGRRRNLRRSGRPRNGPGTWTRFA